MDKHATSFDYFKSDIKRWIYNKFDENSKILDVGAGCGTYYDLLKDKYKNIDAVEIYFPNIIDYNLKNKYINVYNCDIINFKYNYYDLIIFGDIIEHLSLSDAKDVLNYAFNKCKNLIVAVPYNFPTMIIDENKYENHIQIDLTSYNMKERYPMLKLLYKNYAYGYYIKNENYKI